MQEEKPLDGPRQNAAMLELSYDASDNIPRPFTGDVEGEWHDAATFVDQYIAKQGGFAPTDYRVRTVLWYTPETSPAKAQADADQIEAAAVEHLHVLPDSLEPPYTPTYVQPMNPELNIEGHNLVTVIVERAPVCPV
jgi:hypothetical protein